MRPALPTGPRLLRGWRVTAYEAAGAVARVGRRSAAIDALLAAAGTRQAAFVGAWNPMSRARPPGWNHRALARLRARAARAGLRFVDGTGRATRPAWMERHLLLLGDWRRSTRLARLFRQHAMLLVRRGGRARLRVLA